MHKIGIPIIIGIYIGILFLQDKTVYIELDVQECDKYGRVLAYVWLDEETMLQDVLIQNGYAELMTIPPNVKYADRFTAIKTDLHSEQSD